MQDVFYHRDISVSNASVKAIIWCMTELRRRTLSCYTPRFVQQGCNICAAPALHDSFVCCSEDLLYLCYKM